MTVTILLVILVILHIVLVIDKAPTFKRILGQNKQMERDLYSARVDKDAVAGKLRLYKSDLDRANGRIAGLEIEVENANREIEHWKAEAIERKKTLIARGILRG